MKIENFPEWTFPVATTLVGAIAWSGSMPAITLSILMPIAVSLQKSRSSAFMTALGYYAGASWSLIPGAKAFFGANATWLESVLLWLISSFLLALPFGVLWTVSTRLRAFGISLALIIVAVPPIGLIGWASPLTAAGVLFPGTAWLGLAATFLICSLSVKFPRLVSASAALLFVISQVTYREPLPPPSWKAIDTHFGLGFSASDPLRELQITETIQHIIRSSDSKVLVFPEMVIHRWNDAAEAFWEPTLAYMRQEDKTILIGAGLSVPGRSQSYLNSVIILSAHPMIPFLQRIPVPVAMWKPCNSLEGVPLRIHGPGTAMVAGKKAAILICYEQLLVWPIVTSATEHPDILIGIANDYWAARTRIHVVQNASLHAWARVFKLPFISATNT